MSYRISTDIGGTFTDLVSIDESGDLQVIKVSTTAKNYADAIFDALQGLGERYAMAIKDVLKNCGAFIHGSTIATNAIINRNTAKIGLILTKGHRDILTLREGEKKILQSARRLPRTLCSSVPD